MASAQDIKPFDAEDTKMTFRRGRGTTGYFVFILFINLKEKSGLKKLQQKLQYFTNELWEPKITFTQPFGKSHA